MCQHTNRSNSSTRTPLSQGNFQSNKPSTCRELSTGPPTSPRPRWGWAAPAVPSGDRSPGPTWGSSPCSRISAAGHPLLPLSSVGVANWGASPHPLLGQVFGSQLRCTGTASCTSQGSADAHFLAKNKNKKDVKGDRSPL